MIDRRELLEKARERKLNLQIIEKDYVLGWLLFGLKDITPSHPSLEKVCLKRY